MDRRDEPKPVKVGDELNLECISIAKLGDGVFKFQGFVIMVPGAQAGNTYRVKITRVGPRMAMGELMVVSP